MSVCMCIDSRLNLLSMVCVRDRERRRRGGQATTYYLNSLVPIPFEGGGRVRVRNEATTNK